MRNVIPELVKHTNRQYTEDARNKGLIHATLEKQLASHKKFEQLRADWAEKRVNSIFREVARYGVTIKGIKDKDNWRGPTLTATYQDVQMEGHLQYVQMDQIKAYKPWKRPKIVLTLWVLDSKGDRCYLQGHITSALMIVFGAKRMLTYNRLAPAFLDAIAR